MHAVIQQHYTDLFERFPPGTDVLEIGAESNGD
jgi:hypothetical protein